MSKTNILIYLEGTLGQHPYYRVKLNFEGFPYIIVDSDLIFLKSSEMTELTGPYGLEKYKVIKIDCKDELDKILSNHALTCDKLSLKQLVRVS
jgi:hypothetical protein